MCCSHTGLTQNGNQRARPAPGIKRHIGHSRLLPKQFGILSSTITGSLFTVDTTHEAGTVFGKLLRRRGWHIVFTVVCQTQIVLGSKQTDSHRVLSRKNRFAIPSKEKGEAAQRPPLPLLYSKLNNYLLTWNFLLPVLKKSAIWLAAAIPALMLASSV